MSEELNFKAICSLTTRVMGFPEGSLALRGRKRELQVCRSIAGYIGLTEEFEKIYRAYKDIDGAKEIFLDKDFMKNHLLQSGVIEALESDVLLEVKSGEVKCFIKTSFFDFTNQLKNVKLALENYHYTIKII